MELGYITGRTVIDNTGIEGEYDMTLKWTPELRANLGGPGDGSGVESEPSVFEALKEQFGLRLVSDKGPVKTVIIDHVTMPDPN